MHFGQFRNRNRDEQGSALVGFALVAPLVVFVFAVVIQIGGLFADRTTLVMATQAGARSAATWNASDTAGRIKAVSILQSRSLAKSSTVTVLHERRGTLRYVVVRATVVRTIPLLNITVRLSEQGRSLDEAYL